MKGGLYPKHLGYLGEVVNYYSKNEESETNEKIEI